MRWICAVGAPLPTGQYEVHPLRLDDTGMEICGDPLRLHGPRERRIRPLAAIEGRWLWAASRDRHSSKPVLVRVDLGQHTGTYAMAPLEPMPDKFPAAMAVHDQTCFLGWNAEVHAVRLDHRGSRTSVLRCPGCPDWKPFDVICVVPPLVIAIDDIVTPKWRLCIDASHPDSPAVVWGHRFEPDEAYAEYYGAAACDEGMVLWSAYGNQGGRGELLELVEVTSQGISHLADLHLHAGPRYVGAGSPASIQETRYARGVTFSGGGDPLWISGPNTWPLRRPSQSRTLQRDTPFYVWKAMAAVGSVVFIAAGAGGLLRFQVKARGYRVLPRAILGDCLDVVACGGDIAVLVSDGAGRRIVQLRPDPSGGLQGISEVVVDERVWRLVGPSP